MFMFGGTREKTILQGGGVRYSSHPSARINRSPKVHVHVRWYKRKDNSARWWCSVLFTPLCKNKSESKGTCSCSVVQEKRQFCKVVVFGTLHTPLQE